MNKTIKAHLADKMAESATTEIMKWNNGETLYEEECNDFAELFRKALLAQNGYNQE